VKCFYLQAKFAVFRTFAAGTFRPTVGFITPSAAYGLLLNIAGVEMRYDDGKSEMTLIEKNLPGVRIAVGALKFPERHTVFQQLHNYPVGNTGKEHAPNTKGNKYNIVPVRREFLSDIQAYICTDGNPELESWIEDGIAGNRERKYGIPFLGDNNFLIDRFEAETQPKSAFWFEKVDEEVEGFQENITRLTTSIDRADLSQTKSFLFAPAEMRQIDPPPKAWTNMP